MKAVDRQARPADRQSDASLGNEAQVMLEAILESASQAILTSDIDGIIRSANSRCEAMFGYTLDELIGSPVELLIPEALREGHVHHRRRFHDQPHVRPMGVGLDLQARRKDGKSFPVEVSLSFIRTERGPIAIAFVSDITQRKQLEEQLVQSQKMEAVGRLAGGVAHDFNNLLTIIGGYNRLLLESLSPQESLRGYSEEIQKAADRATALTKQLLTFSRRQLIQPRIFNINHTLNDAAKMLRRLIGENIELVIVPMEDLGNVKADPGQVEQVIFNLVANARDAVGETGGRIVVETHNVEIGDAYAHMHLGVKQGPYVLLAVSDNGKGMDAETKRHIFEPFFTTKPANQGTGLGLATVYGIVKQNAGDIWVYSELGQGTTFKVYLPRVSEVVAEVKEGPAAKLQGGSETVLVVEDEPGVRQLVTELLTRHGYNVLAAPDGVQATELAKQYKGSIDLLVTDVVMPYLSGGQLAAQLRDLHPDIKVVYMSGYTENTVLQRGASGSGIHFVQKPFQFDTLLGKVREALGNGDEDRSSEAF